MRMAICVLTVISPRFVQGPRSQCYTFCPNINVCIIRDFILLFKLKLKFRTPDKIDVVPVHIMGVEKGIFFVTICVMQKLRLRFVIAKNLSHYT